MSSATVGDLNPCRGRPLGMEAKGTATEIKAEVPMAEVLDYARDLRQITGGRGEYTMEFARHEEIPSHLAQKVISEARSGGRGPAEPVLGPGTGAGDPVDGDVGDVTGRRVRHRGSRCQAPDRCAPAPGGAPARPSVIRAVP